MSTVDEAVLLRALEEDAIALCSQLIRFDTTNFGGGESRGERDAAEFVAAQLSDVGYEPVVVESAPTRANTVVRIPGRNRTAPALLVHGHLDVVPAQSSDWSFDPFCGDLVNGTVRGRGALDMKDMDAMMLAVARSFGSTGYVPPRDIVMAFVADEEDTGYYGAGFLAREHSDLFDGVKAAIGESGGYTVHLPDGSRLSPIATGERGTAWVNLTATGPAGHGSRPTPGNAIVTLARTLTQLADHRWQPHLTPTLKALVDGLCDRLGVVVDPTDPVSLLQLGDAGAIVSSTLSNTVSPTMLSAGYKHNVVPSEASAGIDGRIVPGAEDEFFRVVDELLADSVVRSVASYAAPVATTHKSAEFSAMAAALHHHDPETLVLPFCMAGGTDAKAFATLGVACYGFTPGHTPRDFPTRSYVHGVDEQVLTDSLRFGVAVLDTYLRTDPLATEGTHS